MRIIAGTFKGRRIPFNNRRQGNARVTSDFVKKAVFSSLGEDLPGLHFLDLFACSGQIGLEAHSRGARVVMNEPDRKRNQFIARILSEWHLTDQIELHSLPAQRLLPELAARSQRFDIVYVDPPYHEQFDDQPMAVAFSMRLSESALLAPNAHIVVQHASRIPLGETPPGFETARQKTYGDTTVTIYQKK